MKPSKLQHRVTRTRVKVSKLLEFGGYSGPSGSGESWFEPRRGNTAAESAAVFVGARPSARWPVLDGACTEPYRGLAKPRLARSTRRTGRPWPQRQESPPLDSASIASMGGRTADADRGVAGDRMPLPRGRRDGSTLHDRRSMSRLLGLGERFPEFSMHACVSTEPGSEFPNRRFAQLGGEVGCDLLLAP